MFYYISGELVHKTESFAVIDAGGVGYRIYSTLSSLKALGESGSQAKLYTYMNLKTASDVCVLYGFSDLEELRIFEMILGVSGVGAKTAINLLSNVSPSKFVLCVTTGDAKYIASHTPGLGPKGAQRIVLELKDKFKGLDLDSIDKEELFAPETDDSNEAVAALAALGYSLQEAKKALRGTTGTVEEQIKAGLKNLMRG
ncbi:MAG: Holliday junction branch migration protein RuvA [Clostridia bacterium]|nr:Holliday junction branch migration protein RuvA [Clostridia bacterium]